VRNPPLSSAWFAAFFGACLLATSAHAGASAGESGGHGGGPIHVPYNTALFPGGCLTTAARGQLGVLKSLMSIAEAQYERLNSRLAVNRFNLTALRQSPNPPAHKIYWLETLIDQEEETLDDLEDHMDDLGSEIAETLDRVELRHISWRERGQIMANLGLLHGEWASVASGQYNCQQ